MQKGDKANLVVVVEIKLVCQKQFASLALTKSSPRRRQIDRQIYSGAVPMRNNRFPTHKCSVYIQLCYGAYHTATVAISRLTRRSPPPTSMAGPTAKTFMEGPLAGPPTGSQNSPRPRMRWTDLDRLICNRCGTLQPQDMEQNYCST